MALISGNVCTVVQGDTLYSIATRFGMSVETLSAANGITDPTNSLLVKVDHPQHVQLTPPTTPPTSDVAATRSFCTGPMSAHSEAGTRLQLSQRRANDHIWFRRQLLRHPGRAPEQWAILVHDRN